MKKVTCVHHILILLLLVTTTLFSCSNKRKKIRLHARDTTSADLAGKWILTDSSASKMNHNTSLADSLKITKLSLAADHSAQVYAIDSSRQAPASAGQWQYQMLPDSASPASIVVLTRKNGHDTIRLSVIQIEESGDTVLKDEHAYSYRKAR